MKLTPTEIQTLTTFTPLTRAELAEREQNGGFAATLEELARADAQAEKPVGQEWWLEQIMGPLRDQQPPLSDYDLAKAENTARRGLNMPPNADTLFTQYMQEELEKLNLSGEISAELLAEITERVQEKVAAEIEAWHEAQEQQSEQSTEQQQLAQFDVMVEDLSAAINQQLADGSLLSNEESTAEKVGMSAQEARSVMNRPDADTLLKQIRAAQLDPIQWMPVSGAGS